MTAHLHQIGKKERYSGVEHGVEDLVDKSKVDVVVQRQACSLLHLTRGCLMRHMRCQNIACGACTTCAGAGVGTQHPAMQLLA